jgi:hypothetical protein
MVPVTKNRVIKAYWRSGGKSRRFSLRNYVEAVLTPRETSRWYLIFEVLTAVKIVGSPEDGCSMFLRNVGTYLQIHMALLSTIQTSTVVDIHCVGGWVDPRVGLDTAVNNIIPVPGWKSIPCWPAICRSLYCPIYLSCLVCGQELAIFCIQENSQDYRNGQNF